MVLKKAAAWFFAIMFFLTGFAYPSTAYAQTNEQRTIRVAFPQQAGISEVDSNGVYSGYTYDYLEEIAQYTGWNYEFVQLPGNVNESLATMLEMLEKGELDLMGSLLYSDALGKKLDFSGQSYGTVNTTLSVLYENTAISQDSYQKLQGIKIAMMKRSKTRISELDQFCQMNNFTYTPVYCETEDEMMQALKDKKADAILGVDMDFQAGLRTIAKFSPRPYYFATTKGNNDIVHQIDSAILSINTVDPYFSASLYETYFSPNNQTLVLSDADKEYIKNSPTLKVGVLDNKAPFQYTDAKTGLVNGIAPDLLDYIVDKSGLKIEMVKVPSFDELERMTNNHSIDLVATLSYDYKLARQLNVSLTKSYASAQNIMLLNKNVNELNLRGKTLALPKDTDFESDYSAKILRFDSLEACINAVNSGKADYTFGNSYSIQYFTNNPKYKNIRLIPQTTDPYKVCIGIVRPNNKLLLNIMNKILISMPEEEMQAIIYKNTNFRQDFTFMNMIEANPTEMILIVIFLAVLIIACMSFILHSRTKLNKKIAMDIKKHYQLYELSNEHFFEYDFEKDKLMLSLQKDEIDSKSSSVTIFDYIRTQHDGNRLTPEQKKIFLDIINSNEDGIEDVSLKLPDGTQKWTRISYRRILDDDGKVAFAIGKLTDIDEEYKEKNSLMEMAQKDGLTNIYNISTCKKMITDSLDQIEEKSMAALFILDIDYFKAINDEYGHFIGDEVLVKCADVISSLFRDDDIVGRLGGDEFIIYMKNAADKKSIEERCEELCQKMRAIDLPGNSRNITVSIGVSFAESGIKYYDLYQKADSALYNAKKRGRNCYSITSSQPEK